MVINYVDSSINKENILVGFHLDNCSIKKIRREKGNFKLLVLGSNFATTVQ